MSVSTTKNETSMVALNPSLHPTATIQRTKMKMAEYLPNEQNKNSNVENLIDIITQIQRQSAGMHHPLSFWENKASDRRRWMSGFSSI